MAKIRKTKDDKCWLRKWSKGTPCTLLVEMQISIAIVENSMATPQKIKNRTTL
jgi:hypothetical protein